MLKSTILVILIASFAFAKDHRNDNQIRRFCERMSKSVVRVSSEDDRASGVVVSHSGLILTAAHAVRKDAATARVVFADGTAKEAKVLASDKAADAAVLQVDRLPTGIEVPAIGAAKAAAGDAVFAFGLPAREDDGSEAVVRIGNILAKQGQLLRSSAILTVGDSGGPLFDSSGRLIALHRQIGAGRLINIHTPIATVLNALKKSAPLLKPTPDADVEPSLRPSDFIAAQPLQRNRFSIVRADGKRVPATYLGHGIVVSKLSLVGPAMISGVSLSSGRALSVKARRDIRRLDIVAFRLQVPEGIKPLKNAESAQFQLVSSPGPVIQAVGIISRVGWNEAPRKKKLGCRLSDDQAGAIRVTSVAEGGAVATAGFNPDDHIEKLNGLACRSLSDLRDALKPLQPGDWVEIRGSRGDEQIKGFGQLRHDSSTLLYRAEFLDGRGGALSERRTGFDNLIQHDLPLTPDQMGSPLVDRKGRLVGVNIARRSREAVFAIPISAILNAIRDFKTAE